jgi:phosphoribulokinase
MEIYKAELSKKYENPIGLEFYTFYLEKSKRGTKFNKDTGIFKVKIIKETSDIVFKEYEYEVTELFKKLKIGTYNIEYFINSFHRFNRRKFQVKIK